MDVFLVAGVMLLAIVIAVVCSRDVHTVSRSDSWQQAVTGLIQEPVAATFVYPAGTAATAASRQAAPAPAPGGQESPVLIGPDVAPAR